MPDIEPLRALSIRQPWAWAILYAGKPIENRPRPTNIRGRILIHASNTLTREDYIDDARFIDKQIDGLRAHLRDTGPRLEIPALKTFKGTAMGGIVGSVEIVDCGTHGLRIEKSPWFTGPYGYVLRNPKPLPFWPCKGQLGFFTRDWPDYLRAA